jgi:hypothetical protein
VKSLKYLACLWLTVVVYALLSMFFGQGGFHAYKTLELGRERQLANIEKLKETQNELTASRNALINDKESIQLRARDLGLATDGAHYARILGVNGADSSRSITGRAGSSATGSVYRPSTAAGGMSDLSLRLAALAAGLALLAVFLMLDITRRSRRSRLNLSALHYHD